MSNESDNSRQNHAVITASLNVLYEHMKLLSTLFFGVVPRDVRVRVVMDSVSDSLTTEDITCYCS